MKLPKNLPGLLKNFFGFLRAMTMILAGFWVLTLAYNSWFQSYYKRDAKLFAAVGEITLPAASSPIGLASNTASEGTLKFQTLRGSLLVDLASNDTSLVSALRQAVIPVMATMIVFAFVVFTFLRNLCANLSRGDVFNEENLRLVQKIGITLIAYSLIGAVLEVWASYVLSGYFAEHVTLTGLVDAAPFHRVLGSPLVYSVPPGLLTSTGGVLVGCLVLVVAEAFKQGLNLKTENDLTV